MKSLLVCLVTVLFALASGPPVSGADLLVVCAPGYPGTTEDAQPTMDELAARLAEAAGVDAGSLEAVYDNDPDSCLTRLAGEGPDLALITAPLLVAAGGESALQVVGRVEATDAGPDGKRSWHLTAPTGKIQKPADLSEWSVMGVAGYAPAYVRSVLSGWGELPSSAHIEFQPRVLSALRKASRGEGVAVLLDDAQAEALPKLPFAESLEILYTTPAAPGQWVVRPAGTDRTSSADWMSALARLHTLESAAELLETMKVRRFTPEPER